MNSLLVIGVILVSMVAARAPDLTVDGNRLMKRTDASSPWVPTRIRGVAGTGALFECIQGRGLFDGPTDAKYMQAMKEWGIEVVRVPTNEDCWLAVNGVKPQYSGEIYQKSLIQYVENLLDFGFNVILELHWTGAGSEPAVRQHPMPDAQHSLPFWRGMARAFGQHRGIIFDVFNEPYPGNNTANSQEAWECWKDGGSVCGFNYTAAGMRMLVDAIRNESAQNVLMLGGINYSNSLIRWLEFQPFDPLLRLAASWHSYSTNRCNNEACWNSTILPVMQTVPVIVGEIGEVDCQGIYIAPLMRWLDSHGPPGVGTSYLAWIWAPWNCEAGPALITDYNGTCTDSYGCTYKAHLLGSA